MVIPMAEYIKTSKVDPQSFWETGLGLPVRKLPKLPKTAVTAPPGFDHGSMSTNVVQAPAAAPMQGS